MRQKDEEFKLSGTLPQSAWGIYCQKCLRRITEAYKEAMKQRAPYQFDCPHCGGFVFPSTP